MATTTIFVDRLQSLSIQWLPLGLYFASRYLKHGGRLRLAAFGACAFLTVQASLYTTVMIAAAVLFVWPLLLAAPPRARGPLARAGPGRGARRGGGAVPAGAVAVPAGSRGRGRLLEPRVRGARSRGARHSSREVAISPPEYGQLGWPLEPWASWDGAYPGAAFVLLLASLGLLTVAAGARHETRRAPDGGGGRLASAPRSVVLGVAAGRARRRPGGERARLRPARGPGRTRSCGPRSPPGACGCGLWPVRRGRSACARSRAPRGSRRSVLFLLSLGSPIAISVEHEPLLHGLFGPLSSLLPAAARAARAEAVPAARGLGRRRGGDAVAGAAPARQRPAALARALAALVHRARPRSSAPAPTRAASQSPALPDYYATLSELRDERGPARAALRPVGPHHFRQAHAVAAAPRTAHRGRQGQPGSCLVHTRRMPCSAGSRRRRARCCCARGASRASWTRGPTPWREPLPQPLPEGLALRSEHDAPRGPGAALRPRARDRALDARRARHRGAAAGRARTRAATAPAHRRAIDGSLHTAAALEAAEAPIFVASGRSNRQRARARLRHGALQPRAVAAAGRDAGRRAAGPT